MLKVNYNKHYHFLLIHCKTYNDGIGVILSLQCIEALKIKFPNATISFLLHSSMQDCVKHNPYLKNIFCIDTASNIIKDLKKAKIDISISLFADKNSTLAIFRAGIKTRIGIFQNLHSLLFNYKIKQKRSALHKHEAQYNLDLLKFLGCNNTFYPKIYLNISEKQESQQHLENIFNVHALLDSGYIAICPSNGWQLGWMAKNFLHIANELAVQYNILIFGMPQETQGYNAMLQNYSNLSEKNFITYTTHNTANNKKTSIYSLRNLLAIISHARLFIGNNTVLLHMASALDIPTLSLFPYKSPITPVRYAPFSKKNIHIIVTPFGIFEPHKQTMFDNDDIQGLRMENIMPELILNILRHKILTA